MSVQAFDLSDGDGVVIVDSVTKKPLSISVNLFESAEEAEAFMSWWGNDIRSVNSRDVLDLSVHRLVTKWRGLGRPEEHGDAA